MSTSSRGDMGRRSVSIKRLATMRNSLFMNTSARQFLGRCGSWREQKDKFINSPSMFDLRAQPTGPSDYYVLRWIEKAQNFIVIRIADQNKCPTAGGLAATAGQAFLVF